MRPIDFPGSNKTFLKPRNMRDEDCLPLNAHVGKDEAGQDFILTVWQPNKEDIEAINSGKPICVKVLGNALPPMLLFTVDDNGNANI